MTQFKLTDEEAITVTIALSITIVKQRLQTFGTYPASSMQVQHCYKILTK